MLLDCKYPIACCRIWHLDRETSDRIRTFGAEPSCLLYFERERGRNSGLLPISRAVEWTRRSTDAEFTDLRKWDGVFVVLVLDAVLGPAADADAGLEAFVLELDSQWRDGYWIWRGGCGHTRSTSPPSPPATVAPLGRHVEPECE